MVTDKELAKLRAKADQILMDCTPLERSLFYGWEQSCDRWSEICREISRWWSMVTLAGCFVFFLLGWYVRGIF